MQVLLDILTRAAESASDLIFWFTPDDPDWYYVRAVECIAGWLA